jgi:hypothetical protein
VTALAKVLALAVAIAAPFGVLGWLLKVYPRPPLIRLGLVPAGLALLVLATPAALWVVVPLDLVLVCVAIADLLTLPRQRHLSAERETVRVASLGKPHRVTLTLLNHSQRPFTVSIRDGMPQELNPARCRRGVGWRCGTCCGRAAAGRSRPNGCICGSAVAWGSGSECWTTRWRPPSTCIPT